ncbi:LytTR family DNA-binding domain-containing protein [Asaia krungthepensis]|uniref:LytR/AlgR family two component response regulator n=1 Tax=Asaia krungthepensis NRIC 0535 TaxID=1307925 RepID=A0ABQ0PYP4_9PROT|nr:LytTR family DNA-binding domain-containing protein [Asaia krungthepensis]GBQ84874.1 LytR/AlgR family two component response regulator [Asaia krungthepensis NRIC 0535]
MLERVAYWIASIMAGLGLYAGPMMLLRRLPIMRWGRLHWAGAAAGTVLLSLVQTLITRDLAFSIWPGIETRLPGWWVWYFQVLAIALPGVMSVMFWQQWRSKRVSPLRRQTAFKDTPSRGTPVPSGVSQIAASAGPVMLEEATRIGVSWPRPELIDALQMEDHYIRCHLTSGSRLVHGVLREAVARQSGHDGLQVHRSWWVARRAVQRWEGTPRSLRLHLRNGLVVPVARAQVAHLRQAGWLEESSAGKTSCGEFATGERR